MLQEARNLRQLRDTAIERASGVVDVSRASAMTTPVNVFVEGMAHTKQRLDGSTGRVFCLGYDALGSTDAYLGAVPDGV